jgi:hypothetical protein
MIERRIIIGLVISTEYIQQIQDRWDLTLFESQTAKRMAAWIMEYFDKYHKAPGKEIEAIFYSKAARLQKDVATEIEEEILPSLSNEYAETGINVDYLVDETIKYFNERNLLRHSDEVRALVETGNIIEAEKVASAFKPIAKDSGSWIDFSDKEILNKIEHAFNRSQECLITYPGALGKFWNSQLTRGAFVALMGPEKRGKTFWLLDLALRACKQKRKVAFFQAGDMSEDDQIMRTSIYLTKKSNKEEYCGKMFEPVNDCVFNQLNECKKKERECHFGIFEGQTRDYLRKQITLDEILEAKKQNKDYTECHNCKEYNNEKWGVPWYKEIIIEKPLTVIEAQSAFGDFFIKYKRQFKLSTHANSTLSVKEANNIMDIWERQDNFIPDVIIFDYPDIMIEEVIKDFRHSQNQIWKDLRGTSQKRHALTIVVTQTDSDSYEKDILKTKNFSEDKRKYGHTTSFYGLNQDHNGREKELGIMRLNEIVVREGDFNNQHQVHVLQNLKRGRPFIGSYW